MKQSAEQSLTYSIGQLLGDRAITQIAEDLPDLVVPVPMHWKRRLVRSTNSPDYVALGIAQVVGAVCDSSLLVSRRSTKKQSLLTDAQRAENVSKAFSCRANTALSGRHIAVVDDIITTGATMNEIASMLRRAGARRISALVVARSTRSDLIIRKPR